jgi:hypothetical protein
VPFIRLDANNLSGSLPDFDKHDLPLVFFTTHNNLMGLMPTSLLQFPSSRLVHLTRNLLQSPASMFADEVQTDVIEAVKTGNFCQLDPDP